MLGRTDALLAENDRIFTNQGVVNPKQAREARLERVFPAAHCAPDGEVDEMQDAQELLTLLSCDWEGLGSMPPLLRQAHWMPGYCE